MALTKLEKDVLLEELKAELIPTLRREIAFRIKNEKQPEYLTRVEACRVLKITKITLWRWVRDGVLKSYCIRRKYYIKRADIDALIDAHEMGEIDIAEKEKLFTTDERYEKRFE